MVIKALFSVANSLQSVDAKSNILKWKQNF